MRVMIDSIQKRDGTSVPFNPVKIEQAILQALRVTGRDDERAAWHVTEGVMGTLRERRAKDQAATTVEEVQDVVEVALMDADLPDAAKAYILYRQQRAELRDSRAFLQRVDSIIRGYVSAADWRVRENANAGYSLSGLQAHIAGAVVAEYTLKYVYPKEVAEAHRQGDMHIHDLGFGTFGGYCAGWSLRDLLEYGFNGVAGKIAAKPARHFNAALGQIVNFLGTLQNEWAGAQAFASFDTYLAPLVAKDGLSYAQVKQCMQEFIFAINATSRWGNQVPFTNITLDWTVPDDLRDQPILYNGQYVAGETYGQFQSEMDQINRAYLEVMLAGDMHGRIFTFPIPTYNLTRDFDWDSPNARLLFEMTAKYGIPYFQNFINSALRPSDVRSMCCRLQLDLRELTNKTGGLFGSGEKTGSIGVVTLNMPRMGYAANTEEAFFTRLDQLLHLARESLDIKRKEVNKHMEAGLLPWSKRYLGSLDHHFATVGVNGMHECCLNFLGEGIETAPGKAFALRVLDHIRAQLTRFQEATGHLYNLEATPAEGAAYRFARSDVARFPDIITAGTDTPYYTNSSQLPVNYTEDVFEALTHQDALQAKYTGGTVVHAFLGERIDSSEACRELVRKIAEQFHLPYFTITPTFSVCPTHGYVRGEHALCPTVEESQVSTTNQEEPQHATATV